MATRKSGYALPPQLEAAILVTGKLRRGGGSCAQILLFGLENRMLD